MAAAYQAPKQGRTKITLRLLAEQLAVERVDRVIFRDISFSLSTGEALILVGRNGAGKTTLLRAVAGFYPLAMGRVSLEGGKPDTPIGEHVHWIGHRNGVKPRLTVRENLAFWRDFYQLDGGDDGSDSRIDAALDIFGLTGLAEFYGGELSAGQQRRVALARLLVTPRPIWLLDEPTVSLDAASVDRLSEAANRHLADGGLILAASHLPLEFSSVRTIPLTDQEAK